MIYNIGITLGLTIGDIDNMTAGEILDLLYYRANKFSDKPQKKEEKLIPASQADYDRF